MRQPMAATVPDGRTRRHHGSIAFGLALSVASAVLICIVYATTPEESPAPLVGGMSRVTLATKDAAFRIVPFSRGGAAGVVWYAPRGPVLRFQLRASGLRPRRRYRVDLSVDDTDFAVASRAADRAGTLAFDTTLHAFADGVCRTDAHPAPRPLAGPHDIKFWLRADGAPGQGTRIDAAGVPPSCRGNGDGVYTHVLLENAIARFVGTAPVAAAGAPAPAR